MFSVNGTTITMINKDTANIEITVEDHTFVSGDKAYFTVKKSLDVTETLIHKEITTFDGNSFIINLTTTDTDLEPDTYKYDIQLNLSDGRVDTVIGPANFVINKGVTEV